MKISQNKITGGYYEDNNSHPIVLTIIGVVVAIALTFMLADVIWGGEVVTEFLAGLIS